MKTPSSQVLMIIAPFDYRDEELVEPRDELRLAGHHVTLASKEAGWCTGVSGIRTEATLALRDVRCDDYDAVVFVGGNGAQVYFEDPDARRIAVEFDRKDKVIGAICVAPTILANAGVLMGRRATAFPSELRTLAKHGARTTGADVCVDGNLVTASGPKFAEAFGERLVAALAAKQHVEAPHPSAPQPVRPSAPHATH
jgi:protease I